MAEGTVDPLRRRRYFRPDFQEVTRTPRRRDAWGFSAVCLSVHFIKSRKRAGTTMSAKSKHRSILPGFGLPMGYTMFYISIMVLIPLAGLFFKSATQPWSKIL